ncbi:uncharacterized protein [Anabrus simplex]
MDLEVVVKKELVWLEETANTSHDSLVNTAAENGNIIKVESLTSLTPKEENDAVDPRTDDDRTVPSADYKNEIFVNEHSVDQLASCFKEEKE